MEKPPQNRSDGMSDNVSPELSALNLDFSRTSHRMNRRYTFVLFPISFHVFYSDVSLACTCCLCRKASSTMECDLRKTNEIHGRSQYRWRGRGAVRQLAVQVLRAVLKLDGDQSSNLPHKFTLEFIPPEVPTKVRNTTDASRRVEEDFLSVFSRLKGSAKRHGRPPLKLYAWIRDKRCWQGRYCSKGSDCFAPETHPELSSV